MEEQGKIKKKRKISIITVFLWLFLIVTMSVITIGSIRKQNAIENSIDKVIIKLDMSQIDDEILEVYTPGIERDNFIIGLTNSLEQKNVNFLEKENKVYTYELEEIPTEDIKLSMAYFDYYENGDLLQSEIQYRGFEYYKEIKVEELQSEYLFEVRGEKLEVNIQGKNVPSETSFVLINQELSNTEYIDENWGMVSYVIGMSYENDILRCIGIRTSQTKSIGSFGGLNLYEGEKPLNSLRIEDSCVSFKDLTESNVYNFHLTEGIIFNIKIEGITDEEFESMTYDVKLYSEGYYGSIENYDEVEKDFENHQIRHVIQTPVKCRYLSLKAVNGERYQVFLEKNGEQVCYASGKGNEFMDLKGAEKVNNGYLEYNITVKILQDDEILRENDDTYAVEQIKWGDKDTGKAQIVLGDLASFRVIYASFSLGEDAIYIHQLDDNFVLSSEYENHPKWEIVAQTSDEIAFCEIPIDVIEKFRNNSNLSYIYVKDTNTIYWKYHISDYFSQSEPIYVYYKNYEEITQEKEILNFHLNSILRTGGVPLDYLGEYDYIESMWSELYAEIKSPNLGFYHTEERNVTVHKKEADGTYYVGLFENDMLSKVEKLEVTEGNGSIQINIENYDETKDYTIFEVDEEGHKITNEAYPVNFSDSYDMRNTEISSDLGIISSVRSGIVNENKKKYTAPVEESEGTGEEDYVDNMLSVTDIYLADVTIGEEVKYKVTYEADEGGKLEGETEEYVKDGDTSQNIPTPVPEEGYEFDKWVIVEGGEEIEVDPSTYIPTKDVTFIAKFKEIPKIVDVDTSDIQVWVYAVITTVAVIGIVVVLVVRKKVKPKENK